MASEPSTPHATNRLISVRSSAPTGPPPVRGQPATLYTAYPAVSGSNSQARSSNTSTSTRPPTATTKESASQTVARRTRPVAYCTPRTNV